MHLLCLLKYSYDQRIAFRVIFHVYHVFWRCFVAAVVKFFHVKCALFTQITVGIYA